MWLRTARVWWWKRGYRRFYNSAPHRDNPYLMNAGTAERFERLTQELEALVRPQDGDTVLDLGGGNGLLSARLFGRCRRLVVMDFCQAAMGRREEGTHFGWVVGDMKQPPFRHGTFTTLFSYGTFPHVGSEARAKRMVEAWDPLLAPGGVLFIGDIPDRRAVPRTWLEALPRLRTVVGAKFYVAIMLQSSFSKRSMLEHLSRLGYDARVIEQSPERRFARQRFDIQAVKRK